VAQYDDLKFLKLSRPEQQEDKLQNALERDVKDRQDHGASEWSTTGAPFYAGRISAPHTFTGVTSDGTIARHIRLDVVPFVIPLIFSSRPRGVSCFGRFHKRRCTIAAAP
jgi:hypothetical protein